MSHKPYILEVSAGGTDSDRPEGARINLSCTGIMATVTGINGRTAGQTNLYTVPAGKTLIIRGCFVRMTTGTGVTGTASAGIGSDVGGTDVYANTFMTGFNSTAEYWTFNNAGNKTVAAAGSTVKFTIGTAFSGGTVTLSVDLEGYLI